MRLIDADELGARLYGNGELFDDENANKHFVNGISTAIEVIDSMPTVDPYAHGYLVENHGRPIWYQCSSCMCRIPKGSKFCNSCGAKLDREASGK